MKKKQNNEDRILFCIVKKIKQESHKIETFKGELIGFGNSFFILIGNIEII